MLTCKFYATQCASSSGPTLQIVMSFQPKVCPELVDYVPGVLHVYDVLVYGKPKARHLLIGQNLAVNSVMLVHKICSWIMHYFVFWKTVFSELGLRAFSACFFYATPKFRCKIHDSGKSVENLLTILKSLMEQSIFFLQHVLKKDSKARPATIHQGTLWIKQKNAIIIYALWLQNFVWTFKIDYFLVI